MTKVGKHLSLVFSMMSLSSFVTYAVVWTAVCYGIGVYLLSMSTSIITNRSIAYDDGMDA